MDFLKPLLLIDVKFDTLGFDPFVPITFEKSRIASRLNHFIPVQDSRGSGAKTLLASCATEQHLLV